jgi:hypothetical protein
MVTEIILSSVVGFVLLIAASYIGTTMALRGFFGREYRSEEPSFSSGGDERETDSKES